MKFPLTPLDHLQARMHFPKLLYFATPEEDPKVIIDTFLNGLNKTLEALPIYAGTICLDQAASKPGTMVVHEPYWRAEHVLRTADLRSQYDFAALERKGFPPDGIDLSLVWPQAHENPTPVLNAQLSLIRNGAILYVGLYHCVADEVGMVNFLRVWSTYCRGEDGAALIKQTWFNQEMLQTGAGNGNREDHPVYNFGTEGQPLIDKTCFFIPSPTVQCDILFFSDASLQRLKHMAEKSVQAYAPDPPGWVSTSDALYAFLWSSISAARLSTEPKPPRDLTSKFRLALNLRSKFRPPLADDYCGNASTQVDAYATIGSIACCKAEPNKQVHVRTACTSSRRFGGLKLTLTKIATAALAIRASYDAITNETVRDLIQMVHNLPDLGLTRTVGFKSQHASLQSTTWASQPYYSMNWGAVVGEKIRSFRGRNLQTDGLTAIFPRIPLGHRGGGGLEVLVGLERSHLDWLKQSEAFSEFTQWRCVTGVPLAEPTPVQGHDELGSLEGLT